jgi:hypothetical protein
VLAGCATNYPPEPNASALYRDLERLVTVAETAGWDIDRLEVDSMLQDALASVCRVGTSTTAELIAWLDAEIDRLGGPVEKAYVERGRDLTEVEELLELTRIRMLLREGERHRAGDCPFWIDVEPEFIGQQILDDRWLVYFATSGRALFVRDDGQSDLNAGGGGRLLFGRGIGPHLSIYSGLELGAVASFPREPDGSRGKVVIGLDGAVPLVVRYRMVNTFLEAEAGWFGHVTEVEPSVEQGIHVGVAFGGQATKQILAFPGAAIAVVYERTFPRADQGLGLEALRVEVRFSAEADL